MASTWIPSFLLLCILQTGILNKHLQDLMEGLTAKVFRTYNASITLQQQLKELTARKYCLARQGPQPYCWCPLSLVGWVLDLFHFSLLTLWLETFPRHTANRGLRLIRWINRSVLSSPNPILDKLLRNADRGFLSALKVPVFCVLYLCYLRAHQMKIKCCSVLLNWRE